MPRGRKKTNKRVYDPNAKLGYEILNNYPDIEQQSTELQNRTLDTAASIDYSIQRLRRLNSEEDMWEDIKKKERKAVERLMNDVSFPSIGGGQNHLGVLMQQVGSAYRHFKNKDLPNQPDDYGISDFLKDQWNAFFGEMNNLQAQDAKGLLVRSISDIDLIKKYNQSLDKLDEIDEIDERLNELRELDMSGFTSGQLQTLKNEIDNLTSRRNILLKEYNDLKPERDRLEGIVKQSSIGAAYDQAVSGSGFLGNSIEGVVGKTTAMHDEINDARRFLYDLGSPNRSRMQTRLALNRALKEYDSLNKEWQAIVDENEKDAEKYKNKVSAWYKSREEKASTDFFDPDTYLFKMPGIMGGSSSSYMKQIPAMIAGLTAGIVSGGLSTIPAMATLAAGGASSFYMQRGAGVSENNAEVALAAIEKIKNKTGLSEKQINDVISGKDTDIKKLRLIQDNIKNAENLFNTDMAATTWDAAIDAILNTVPIGAMSKLGKYVRGTKAWTRAMQRPAIKKVLESKFGEDIVLGFGIGELAGPGAGVAVAGLNATAGRAARYAGERLGNFVISKADNTIYGALAHDLWKQTQMLGRAASRLEPDTIDQASKLINGTRIKYAKGIGGRLIKAGISEGIEEGKQHVNAEAFKNEQLNDKIMSVFDVGLTDALNGLTMGAYILGIPLDGIGLIDIKDRDLLQEIKGGMLGGWGHTATINVLRDTPAYIREQKANEIILQQMYADKLASQSDFNQYVKWQQKGLFSPGYSDVLSAFDRLRNIDEDYYKTNGVHGISQELIDNAEKKYKLVISIAKDPLTRIEAKNAGIAINQWYNITPGIKDDGSLDWRSNKDYHEFVAAKAIALDKIDEVKQSRNEAIKARQDAERQADVRFAQDLEDLHLQETLGLLSNDEGDSWRLDQENEERKLWGVKEKETELQKTAAQQIRENQNSFDIARQVARLSALLKYRDQIETGLEAQKNNPHARVRRGLKDQLARLNRQIDLWIKINENIVHSFGIDVGNNLSNYINANQSIKTLDDVENHLVIDLEIHESLRDAYLEEMKWNDEYESAEKSYENLVGRPQKIEEDGTTRDIKQSDLEDWDPRKDLSHFTTTGGNARTVLDNIHKMQDDDDDFESLIERVYKEDLKAEHLNEENAWKNPEMNYRRSRPVNNANGELIRVQYNEKGQINRRLAENEYVDEQGRLWEYVDDERKDPLKEALRPRLSDEEFEAEIHRTFAETWNRITGTVLPMSPEAYFEQRRVSMFLKAALSSSTPPTVSSPEGGEIKPPAEPPTPPITPISPIEPEKTPQDETMGMLIRKYEEDKKAVLNEEDGYHTTSLDYFILDSDNNVIRASRVHNVKPESFRRQNEIDDIEKIYKSLNLFDNTDELISHINKEYSSDDNVKRQIIPYIKYIQDNRNLFFIDKTPESIREYNTTLQHLALAIVNGRRKLSSSIRMGNVADELGRNFFGSDQLYILTSTQGGIQLLYQSKNESEDRTYKDLFYNYEAFEQFIQQLRAQYEYYTVKLGWKLSTLPFTWKANFTTLGWVAGQTDLIGVDIQGGIHIIDFKTSKYGFGETYSPNIKLTLDYFADLNVIHKEDFKNGRPNKKVRNILKGIKEDSNSDFIEIQWRENNEHPELSRAVVVNKDRPFMRLPWKEQYGQEISTYQDYKNQLTAYARMVQIETGGTVKSVEILPMRCTYDSDLKTIHGIHIEERLVLPFSKQMLDILDAIPESNETQINSLLNDIASGYQTIIAKREELASNMSNEVFDTLSENAKLLYSDYLASINNLVSLNIESLTSSADDINLLQSTLDKINDLLSQYQTVVDSLNEDYAKERAKLSQNEEKREKNERIEQKVQGTPDGEVVDTVRARNKNISKGNDSHTNLNYKQVESDRELELATSSPDFITRADFNLYTDCDNDTWLQYKAIEKSLKNKDNMSAEELEEAKRARLELKSIIKQFDVYVDITYNGKTWKKILIDTKYNGERFINGELFFGQIKDLEILKKPGQRIVPIRMSMNRTNGAIKLARNKDLKIIYLQVSDTDLFAGFDIYDIEFSATFGNIGFIDDKGLAITFDGSESQRKPIYLWKNPRHIPKEGTLIYLKHVHKDELNRDSIIPVAIDRIKLKDTDINFILQLLQNPDMLDREFYTEIDGEVKNLHATGRQIANLMLPVIDSAEFLGNITSIFRNPANPNIISLMNRKDLIAGTNGRGTFDISTQKGREDFIKELKAMSIAERHDVLLSRLGTDNSRDLPFAGIRKFFIENNAGNKSIRTVKITDAISFDLDDFKTVVSKTNSTRNGLNGLGYYLRHNMLITQYVGMGSCNVEIREATLEDSQTPNVLETGALEIPAAPTVEQQVIDSSAIDAFLLKQADEKTILKKKLTKEKAEKHLKEILGDNVPLEFLNDFLKVASGAAHVVGNCKADAIVLSDLAWRGVEYHEAYHRIFEMLLPESKRDFIFEKIAKRIGVELYNKDGSENEASFRQCSEYAADKYMQHMNHHMTDIKIPFLTKIFNKIHDWVSMFVHFNDRDLYRTFIEVNKGKYKNAIPSKKAVDRFNRLYKELYCQIHGVDFEHIVNRPMYDKLKQTVLFCIIQGQNVDKSGKNIQEVGKHIDKATFKAGVNKMLARGYDIFGEKEGTIPTVGQLAMKEIYDNFDKDALRDDIANEISAISTDFVKIREQESNEDAQGDEESVKNANIGEHTKSSYEFSRFEKTSSRVRFFFATIPDFKYGKTTEVLEDGKRIIKKQIEFALNEFGLPQFVPVNSVFNEVLNYFHDVDTVDELLSEMQFLAKEDAMFETLYKAVKKVYESVYTVKDGQIVRNSDQEALLVQLMNVIRSNKHSFDIAKAEGRQSQYGMYTLKIQPSDTEYNARFYPTQWNQMLVNGGTPILKISERGQLLFNPKLRGSDQAFTKIYKMFDHYATLERAENGAVYNDVGIKQWLDNYLSADPKAVYLRLNVNGKSAYYNNPKDASQLEVVKDKIIEALNIIGINFNLEEFNYMLRHKYGSTDAAALSRMFNSTSVKDSMTSFLNFLRDVASNGQLKQELRVSNKKVKIKDAYSLMAFVKELANWKYQYRHAHDQLTVLATGNNKFYEISDNNYVSDVVRFINKRSEEFEEIKSDVYNYFADTDNVDVFGNIPKYGSLILEYITEHPDAFVTLRNFIGFKTDKRGDQGSDYFEISKREDYVAKATILEEGGIIMPTLSDKKTWMYLDGIKLPGLDYSNIFDNNGNVIQFENLGDQFVISKDPVSQWENMLSQDPEVISRFISYAITEYKSILKADADLDEMERNGTKSTEVDNYYTEEQGARFSSLLGVWEYDYKKQPDGSMLIVGETFHSFNDFSGNRTRKDNIKDAETYFFNRSREVQEALISRLLHKRLLKEIDTCVKLGLILKINDSDNIFENYENVGLNSIAIEAIFKSLVAKNGVPVDGIATQRYKSLATIIYINDISNKAIMSGQEIERVFSGNPAFYEWKYDKDGKLKDRTVNELKRLGGLASTGNNNFTELKDVPSKYLDENGKFTGKYVCALVNDELIASPQLNTIKELMKYGEISTAAYLIREEQEISSFRERINHIRKQIEYGKISELSDVDRAFYEENFDRMDEVEQEIRVRISNEIDSTPIEELEKQLPEDIRKIALRKAKESSDSYKDDINVADGSAYITDTMAEMLLRMNGNYSSAIEKAFKILREEVRSTILEKHQAYQAVLTEVIGTQKYTAFGRRKHQTTGILISYYNKMALFPMFKCMCTGRLQNVFNKMKQQEIDMLLMDSAVKIGGQYSKSLSEDVWNQFRQTEDESDPKNHVGNNINNPLKPSFDDENAFKFGTYEQKFIYLRKQLNTDPTEDYMMGMGTQMTKIAMTNLLDGRTYYMLDGTELNGMELRNNIMDAINELSNMGLKSIIKRFFKTNAKGELIDKDGNPILDEYGAIDYSSPKKVLDEVKFSREVRKLLQTRDADKNILDALEIVEEKQPDGTIRKHMRLPLNAISNSKWLESILISEVNRKIIDVETTGAAFIQRSVWQMEGSSLFERKKGNILSDEDMSPKINNGERLQLINEEGSTDCVVSVDFIKKMLGGELPRVPIKDKNRNVIWDLVPQLDKDGNVKNGEDGKPLYKQRKDKEGKLMFDEKGKPIYARKIRTREMTFDELRKWLINRGIIGKDAHANIIGYRIPTQAQSSIHAFRIVDILPVVNDTVILPAEFTKTTGSDFDIDKLFLSSIQYKVNREEGEDGKYHQTITDVFDSKEDTYFQNNLIRYYITLLLDWKSLDDHTPRTTNSLNRPIDRDTDLLKDIIKDLEENKPTAKEEPYMFYSLSTQTESKNDYITGKIGIGPFALNNNNHVLTMMYHVRFKHIESSIMSALDLEQLDRRVDKNGESILSWLSGLINAHVDIAKDPYISRLNVNPFTYNIVNLLVRTGLGDKTFYFTTQPIMKALAEAYINAGSMYMNDQYRSKYTLQQEAIDKVAEQWFKDSGILFEGKTAMQLIDAVIIGGELNADIRTKINNKIKELFDKNIKADAKGELNLENQLFYYLAYLQFDKYAKALSSLVTYSKIDTKKHGKSVTEHLVYEQGYNKTYDVTRDSSLFDPVGLSHMRNDSYIAVKTNNAINSIRDILGSQFIQSTPAFLGSVNAILKAIGREDSLSANLVSKVADALSAAIKSKFFTEQYVPTITDNPNFMHDLVSESQEVMDFAVRSQGNVIELSGKKYHNLQSYINKPIQLGYKMTDGSTLYFVTTVIGVNDSANTVTVQHVFPPMYGTAVLRGGENTIYDRFSRLSVAINSDPAYSNLKDESGNISNRLLLMLVPGKETRYTPAYIQGEQPDTYETMKFVKFFNFVEDSGNTANYIIDAWEELLGYTNDNKEVQKTVRDFARDLIVYGFMTSGDKGGFKKIFKYVPASWRESSGYGNYIYDKLVEYSVGDKTDIDIQDVILNNWFDNEFVRTYTLKDKETDKPQFMEYHTKINGQLSNYPTILAALKNENGFMVPSIDPENAPLFIKIKRRFDYASYDSQRRFTVYKFHKMAISNTGVEYPVYIKVNPKGNQTSDGFLITEYGRSDAINMPEYEINEQVLEATYKATNVTQYVQSISKTNKEFAAIISGLNRKYQEDVKLDEVVSSAAENQQMPQTTSASNTVSQVPSESPQLSILSESQKPDNQQSNNNAQQNDVC